MNEAIANFTGITGASEDVARQVVEMCAGDAEQAVMLWFNDEELQRSLTNPSAAAPPAPATSSSRAPPASSSAQSSARLGRRQPSGANRHTAIPIDDSDDDLQMTEDSGDDDDAEQAARIARTAQEAEDAAFAQQMQEQLYASGGGAAGEDGVRAPMGRTTETLVAPSGFADEEDDGFAAFQAMQMQRRMASMRPGASNNPFAQNIWDTDNAAPGRPPVGPAAGGSSSRASHLAELFAPPRELIARLSWEEARDIGKQEKRWILVNLQNASDFHCQALNRDIWKDEGIKSLVQEHFVFLQYDKDLPHAQEYVQFYFPNQAHERAETYPHVAIIDPRTGEQVKTWSGAPFPNALDFHAQLAEFLDRYSLEANSKNPVSKVKPPKPARDFDRMTEEEMLEMALANSMGENGGTSSANAGTPPVDPDALTKIPEPADGAQDKGKGKATEPEPAEEAGNAAFARISSDNPHTEPDNNPSTTTRIQFRHPEGRIIRRFNLSDPVVRIYEWLKADPLPGKGGLEFELKVAPEGRDLIDDVNKSIADAGLRNGTAMIEFI